MRVSTAFLRKRGVATEGRPYNVARLALLLLSLYLFLPIQLVRAQDPLQETKPAGATIRGQVVYSDTGHPLRHARLNLISIENNASSWSGATNKRGEFVFENVPPGQHLIIIDSLNILRPVVGMSRLTWTNLLRLGEREFLTEVSVSGTENLELKIKAQRGGVITGRVFDENDEPVADAEVRLLKREADKWIPVAATWPGRRGAIRTDTTGTYRVTGLRSGDYLVRVSEASLSPDNESDHELYGEGYLMATYYPDTAKIKDAQAVSVIQGRETTGVDVRLPDRQLYTVSGTLTFGSEGRSGFMNIRRKEEVGVSSDLHNVTVATDKDGNWRAGLPDGEYVLTAHSIYSDSAATFSAAPKRLNLKVAGSDITGIKISLTRGANLSGKVNVDGRSVSNLNYVSVALIPVNDPPADSAAAQADIDLTDVRGYYVNHAGNFSMRGLAPGKYWFQLTGHEQSKYYVKAVTRKGVNLISTPIQLTEGMGFDGVEVVLSTNLPRVEGVVTLPENVNKKSFRGVVVVLVPANELTRRFNPRITTALPDEQGKFRLDCLPGDYFVAALSADQIKRLSTPLSLDYFKDKDHRLVRVTVQAGEKPKGITVPVVDN